MRWKFYGMALLSVVSLTFFSFSSTWAYCDKGEYFGITSGQPVMSTIDVSSSTFYSFTSTSGTSGCKNWNFTQYLEESRKKFITRQHQQLLEQTSQGEGPHLDALGQLMGCSTSDGSLFAGMLQAHHTIVSRYLTSSNNPKHVAAFLGELKQWIVQHPQLKYSCTLMS